MAPSILSADFGRLAQEVGDVCASGCDWVHLDVMDGHFVPMLSFGPPVIACVAQAATKPLDIHLMVESPLDWIDRFAVFKPAYLSFHVEATPHPHRVIMAIRDCGISPAIAINPHTPLACIEYLLSELDMVLVMGVNPGFGGQMFLPFVLDKIVKLKAMLTERNLDVLIEVDGGVDASNTLALKQAGVDVLVAGSFIYRSKSYAEAIATLQH